MGRIFQTKGVYPMVHQRLRVGNLIGEFHLPQRALHIYSKNMRPDFHLSFCTVFGPCYEAFGIKNLQDAIDLAYTCGDDYCAETLLQILEELS